MDLRLHRSGLDTGLKPPPPPPGAAARASGTPRGFAPAAAPPPHAEANGCCGAPEGSGAAAWCEGGWAVAAASCQLPGGGFSNRGDEF